jgi:hypothetical protein
MLPRLSGQRRGGRRRAHGAAPRALIRPFRRSTSMSRLDERLTSCCRLVGICILDIQIATETVLSLAFRVKIRAEGLYAPDGRKKTLAGSRSPQEDLSSAVAKLQNFIKFPIMIT